MQYPNERVKMRLLREAQKAVATAQGRGFLDIEETYALVRTGLVHMISGAAPLAGVEIRTLFERMMPDFRHFLAEISSTSPRSYVRRLSGAATALTEAYRRAAATERKLTKEDVDTFLSVLEEYRTICLSERYNPNDIIPTDVYLLGIVIADNFEQYGERLNSAA